MCIAGHRYLDQVAIWGYKGIAAACAYIRAVYIPYIGWRGAAVGGYWCVGC